MFDEEIEGFIVYTLTDADEVIKLMGFAGFIQALFSVKKERELTEDEVKAMQVLHEGWEL